MKTFTNDKKFEYRPKCTYTWTKYKNWYQFDTKGFKQNSVSDTE